MGVTDSIFEPHPSNFGKSDIFLRSTNDVTIIFGNFHFYKSWKKRTQARRPGVEESLAWITQTVMDPRTREILYHRVFLLKSDLMKNHRIFVTL